MFGSKLSILASGVALLATTAQAVCPDYHVGVGYSQLCSITGGSGSASTVMVPPGSNCGGNLGAIFANNCGHINLSWEEDICKGGWDSGYGIDCNDDGSPSIVYTTGGNFGNCYPTGGDQSCTVSIGISSEYNPVDWCCAPL